MRIGELAQRGNVTIRTIRYYIEQGLLPLPPMRGKYGDFDESYLQRLRLIQHLKEERLSLLAIRRRLEEMGLPATPLPPQLSLPSPVGHERKEWQLPQAATVRGEGLFRSRFAEEAGLTPEQVSQLEAMGLLESSEGLLLSADLPLARAAARLLSKGATIADIAELTGQVRQETGMHQRLLDQSGSLGPLARALQWQEQAGAVSTIRQILLRRWSNRGQEQP